MNEENLDIDSLLQELDIEGIINEESSVTSSSNETNGEKNSGEATNFSCLGIDTKMGEELKLVSQLDNVTKETEQNATAVFDILHDISNDLVFMSEVMEELKKEELSENVINKLDELENYINHSNNVLFEGMSLMQYQDISRQKIERVVNIMRSLIKYLNVLFEGEKSDDERTSSANHINGDSTTDDLIDNDDLDDLINSFNNDK